MKYSKYREIAKTGDVVLFHGKGRISRWIRWFISFCNWLKKTWASHLGTVIVSNGRVMLLESTSIKGGFKGVRLVPLSEAIPFYDGKIKIRQLKCKRDEKFYKTVDKFIADTLGKLYEKNIGELMGSAWDGWLTGHNKPDFKYYFCSELVAHLFQELRLLTFFPPANEYTPEDFRLGGLIDGIMKYGDNPACLGREIDIEV